MSNLRHKAFDREIYATDGLEVIRTTPKKTGPEPFVGYIKNNRGEETQVRYDNETLNDVLISSQVRELTREEYENA